MEQVSNDQQMLIEKWQGVAERLRCNTGAELGISSIPMAQALHFTAQAPFGNRQDPVFSADSPWDDWWEKRHELATRAVSVQELAQDSLDHLARVHASTQACVGWFQESALAHAHTLDRRLAKGETLGALGGMPLAHKDLVHRAGSPVSYGMAQSGVTATSDATVLRRFDQADALHLARLHMTELAFDPSGANELAGHCRNPWSTDHIPGGSSSGSATVVAAGAVYGALGSDTGGSIRIPAALCGVTGLKPTYGLVSRAGAMSLSSSLDHLGPIARSARDCALMLQAMVGHDLADAGSVPAPHDGCYVDGLDTPIAGLRVGVPQGYFTVDVDPRMQAMIEQNLAVFRALGAEIREVPDFPYDALNDLAILMIRAEATSLYRSLMLPDAALKLGQFTRARLEEGIPIPASLYVRAGDLRGALLQQFAQTVMADVDVLLAPVFPGATPRIETFDTMNAESRRLRGDLTRFTRPINYLGLPSLSLPGGTCAAEGTTAELPAGFQLIGRPYGDGLLLRSGHAFQKATSWHLRRPPLAAE